MPTETIEAPATPDQAVDRKAYDLYTVIIGGTLIVSNNKRVPRVHKITRQQVHEHTHLADYASVAVFQHELRRPDGTMDGLQQPQIAVHHEMLIGTLDGIVECFRKKLYACAKTLLDTPVKPDHDASQQALMFLCSPDKGAVEVPMPKLQTKETNGPA